jgi:hypothetical protein
MWEEALSGMSGLEVSDCCTCIFGGSKLWRLVNRDLIMQEFGLLSFSDVLESNIHSYDKVHVTV